MQRPDIERPAPVRVMFPTGGLLDIPTGQYLKGTHDQRVLNGGVGLISGIVGPGNSFKTTIMRWMEFTALSRLIQTVPNVWGTGYDTEVNSFENRNNALAQSIDVFKGRDIINEGVWVLTDKTVYMGNEFWMKIKQDARAKRDEKNGKQFETAFLERDGNTPMKMLQPTFTDFDSLTHFMTDAISDTLEKVEIDDSKSNMVFAHLGGAKAKMLLEMPHVAGSSCDYFMFTAHIGEKIAIPAGPTAPPPRKQLQHMPPDVYVKGVTNNFFYLLHSCWFVNGARPFLNQGTKGPEYPRLQGEEVEGDLDLNIVTLKQLRGKNGQSGFSVELMVSQKEGVLPALSEFHYLKKSERFGLIGTDRNYAIALMPDMNLSRTTVRQKLSGSRELRRAVEITSQIAQLLEYNREMQSELLAPEELYHKLKEQGYNWEMILKETRGWHTLNDEEHPGYPWSTLDLCRAAKGEYHPYWLDTDRTTLLPEYAQKKLQGTF